jgi:hypothetical protein
MSEVFKRSGKTDLTKILAGRQTITATASPNSGSVGVSHGLGYYPGYKAFFTVGSDPTIFAMPNAQSGPVYNAKVKNIQMYFWIQGDLLALVWINLGSTTQTLTVHYMLYANRVDTGEL